MQGQRLLQRQRVVHLLRTSGPLARADLAQALGVSRSTITTIVADLIADETLVELDHRVEGPNARGRPRILLGCNPRARRVVGIWINEHRARIVLADATGNVSAEGHTPTGGRDPDSVMASIVEIAEQLTDSPGGAVAAAGVCIPGFVNIATGTVDESRLLGWSKIDLGHLLSRRLGVPTAVLNTTHALTLAEAIAGEARGARSAVILDCGRQFGAGLIIDGRPYTGATGAAGVIGRLPFDPARTQCRCSRDDCTDTTMPTGESRAHVPHVADVPLEELDLAAVWHEVHQGPEARDMARDVIDRIAHTALFMEALIDPEMLIIAGLDSELEELGSALHSRIMELRPLPRRSRTSTVRSRIGSGHLVSVIVALQQLDDDIAALLQTSLP
jgi:predicted NBD/HSP70 family sugar kinase